jgi:hypothetical protein
MHLQEEEGLPAIFSGITETSLVHYVAYNGRCLAGMVIGHNGKTVDLVIFTNMPNFNGVKNFGQQFHQNIGYDQRGTPGTWHWPTH